MTTRIAPAGIFLILAGCVGMPPVDFNYYPSAGTVFVKVTQSVDCSKDKTRMVMVTSAPDVTVKYAADHSVQPWTFQASGLRSELANNDFTLNLYEDGRLRGLNAQSTGQGETILKNVISLVSAVLPFVGGAGPGGGPLPECDIVANVGNGKPVPLTYAGSYELRALSGGGPVEIPASPDSAAIRASLNANGQLGPLQARLEMLQGDIVPGSSASTTSPGSTVQLRLQRVGSGKLHILSRGTAIWTGAVLVPRQDHYELPVPRAALFGKSTFAIEVAESGAVTKLQYGRDTGAAAPIAVLTSAATTFAPDTAAERASELKGKADEIAQAQRLARCIAQPDECK